MEGMSFGMGCMMCEPANLSQVPRQGLVLLEWGGQVDATMDVEEALQVGVPIRDDALPVVRVHPDIKVAFIRHL